MLDRLARGEEPEDVLGPVESVLVRGRGIWRAAAAAFLAEARRPTRVGAALGWLAVGILGAIGEELEETPDRPWSDVYDLAEARRSAAGEAEPVIGDFLADQIWSLAWAVEGAFDRGRAFVSMQAAVARVIARRIVRQGARPDRAAAEAVLVIEVGSGIHRLRAAFDSVWSIRSTRGQSRPARDGNDPGSLAAPCPSPTARPPSAVSAAKRP